MAAVVGVRFKNAGKLYYFDPGTLWPVAGDFVVVETARGMEYGQVITGVRQVEDGLITAALKKVVRVADARDAEHAIENERFQAEVYPICQRKIEEHKLDMKLVSVEQTFDNSKILFYFTANGRVDFRALVKDLASVFRTRIELRQIGVRDEAKMMGGLGPCGRPICCGSFLGDFQPVSIKMAKEQNLSLNPTKISGVCGRLMCCLKYEQDYYEQTRKSMPRVGKEVETPEGFGMVVDVNVIKEQLTVRIRKGDTSEVKSFKMEEIKWNRPAPQPIAEQRPRSPRAHEPQGTEPAKARPARKYASDDGEGAKDHFEDEQEGVAESDWRRAVEKALSDATQGEQQGHKRH